VAFEASLFVAVLGASSYTFAEATKSQKLACWITSHVHALELFGAAPEIVVPDNAKTGIKRPCRYEPDLNPTCREMAEHYGLAVVPARPYKARDKTCASYCTLSRFCSGQDWLGRSATAMTLHDCGIPNGLI